MRPVPTDAIRSGRLSPAPCVVTRTGRMACTPCPGESFIARKSNPSVTYASRIGCTAVGMSNPFCVSHESSAPALVECNCTVSYGPTVDCLSTCTVLLPPPLSAVAPRALPFALDPQPPPDEQLGDGQL